MNKLNIISATAIVMFGTSAYASGSALLDGISEISAQTEAATTRHGYVDANKNLTKLFDKPVMQKSSSASAIQKQDKDQFAVNEGIPMPEIKLEALTPSNIAGGKISQTSKGVLHTCVHTHPVTNCNYRLICEMVCSGAAAGAGYAAGGIGGAIAGGAVTPVCNNVCRNVQECQTTNVCDQWTDY